MPDVLRRRDIAERLDLIERCVGPDPDPSCWRNARLSTAGPDGLARGGWLIQVPAEQRVEQVRELLLSGTFSGFREVAIPKPGGSQRTIAIENTVEHAAQWVVKEALEPVLRPTRSHVAVGYVPGVPLHAAILRGVRMCRTHGGAVAWEADIQDFFGTMRFDHLRRVLDGVGAHGAVQLDDDLKDFLMGAATMPAVDEAGGRRTRQRGIAQGMVLAPCLANLYLSEADRKLCRRLAKHGEFLRSSDNFLGTAKTVELCRIALGVVKEELARVGLTLKDGATKVCDLRNRANAPTWLGTQFTFTAMWVPKERIMRKAAELQAKIDAGLVRGEQVGAQLDSLRAHYQKVIGPAEAARVHEAILRRLDIPDLHFGQEEKGIEHIRKQIEPLFTSSVVARVTLVGEQSQSPQESPRTGQEDPCGEERWRLSSHRSDMPGREPRTEERTTFSTRSSLKGEREPSSPPGGVSVAKGTSSPSSSPPRKNAETSTQDPPGNDSRSAYTGRGARRGSAPGDFRTLEGTAPIPSRPGADPATHRRRGHHKSANMARRLIDSWTLQAVCGVQDVVVLARDRNGVVRWRLVERVEGSRCRTEAFLVGLMLGVERLLVEGAGSTELVCDDIVMRAYLGGCRIRSPRIARRMVGLMSAVERFGRAFVVFKVADPEEDHADLSPVSAHRGFISDAVRS